MLQNEDGEGFAYASFDDPVERSFATADPIGFLGRFGDKPVILDEIQYVLDLLPSLKHLIDCQPLPYGITALPWQVFPQWLADRKLCGASGDTNG